MSEAFRFPVRVYFEDTDAGGVVYYANYLKFYERTRSEWLRSLGISQQQLARDSQILFVVRNVRVDYYRSAVLDDMLTVTLSIAKLRGASIEFEQKIIRNDGVLCSSCQVTIACVNANKMKPTAFPKEILERFKKASLFSES